MTFKGLIDLEAFLSESEKVHYNQMRQTYVDDTAWAEWLSTFAEIGPLTPETEPFSHSQPDQESTNGATQEPISNEIKGLDDSKNLCSFSKNPEVLSGGINSAHSAHPNKIKDFSAKAPAAVDAAEDTTEDSAEKRTNSEFFDVTLPTSTPWGEMIAAMPHAHGGEKDISFGCPFFRQKFCDAHALRIETQWSLACDYACKHSDMIQALAENNPDFADLIQKYGIRKNGDGEGIVDGGVPFFITQDMRTELRDLGYADEEIDRLKPAEAHKILRGGGKL